MLDKSELMEEYQRLGTPNQGTFLDNFVRMPEGEGSVIVRILPPTKGGKLYCATRTHKLNNKNLHCPQVLVNKKWQGNCPICEYYRRLWKLSEQQNISGDQSDAYISEARSIKPIERCYYNVIVRQQVNPSTSETEKDVGPKILSIGKQLHTRIIRAILGDPTVDEPELGDVTDLESGRDFKIIKKILKSGKDSFPNYEQSKFLGESVIGTKAQATQWLSSLHDLNALRQVKSMEELIKELRVFRGEEESDDTKFDYGNNKTSKPASAPATTVSKSAKVEEDSGNSTDESLVDDDFLAQLRNL